MRLISLIIAALFAGAGISQAVAAPLGEPTDSPTASLVQEVAAQGEHPGTERDQITVETPAPVEPVAQPVEPVEVETETVAQPEDTPAIIVCDYGFVSDENGQCVPERIAPMPFYTLEPCEHDEVGEGIPDCYWNAQTRGNGEGRSFVWLQGVLYYPEG